MGKELKLQKTYMGKMAIGIGLVGLQVSISHPMNKLGLSLENVAFSHHPDLSI